MNCQDISRLADNGRVTGLKEADRRAAEAHALTCRSCAAVWGAHARLAELPVPPMPAELRSRCQALVMLPEQARSARGPRRLILVGSLVGVAAAAGILMMQMQSAQEPSAALPVALNLAVPPAAATPPESMPDSATSAQDGEEAAAGAPDDVTTAQHATLPLLPMPVAPDKRPVEDLALQKLVQRHPELVDGPDLEGAAYFLAVLAMRPNGDVISSAVRIPTGINAYELDHELNRTLPTDAGNMQLARRKKHTVVPDGRALRADLSFKMVVVPAGYNTSRSTNRVREILGIRYNHLLLPSAGRVLNRLTILLSPDGTILHESVDLERQELTYTETRADDPNDVARVAAEMAKRLGIDVNQIGLMGTTRIEDGTIRLVDNGTLGGFVDDKRRELVVSYAWQRGSGESSATLRQNGVTKPLVDTAAALAIVEQQIPQAFTSKPVGAETYLVVLAASGQFIRAGRVQMYGTAEMMARQLVPGVKTTSFTTVRLTNKAGATADVRIVWEVPEAGTEKPAN